MSRTRVSRGLIAGIGVVIVIGGVAYLNKVKDTHAANDPKKGVEAVAQSSGAKPQAAGGAAPAPVAPAKPKSTGQIALPGSASALVTQTPGAPAPTSGTG